MADKYMTELADSLALPLYLKQSTFGSKDGVVLGVRDGFLVAAGPGKNDEGKAAIKIMVRYKAIEDVSALQQAVDKSENLKMLSKNRQVVVGEDFLLWTWQYSLSKPKASFVADFVHQLLAEIKLFVSPPEDKCELCPTASREVVLYNGVPGHYCNSCQSQAGHQAGEAAREYSELETNLPMGILFGAGAALAGALVWGGVAYTINYIFAYGAIGIGWLVGLAIFKGAGKITWPGRIAAALLTLASIMLGDIFFYSLLMAKEFQVPLSMEVVSAAFGVFQEIEFTSEGGLFSIIFALVGAGYAIYTFKPPAFEASFETLGTPEYTPARGAAAGMS
jgi:hypothetical protein